MNKIKSRPSAEILSNPISPPCSGPKMPTVGSGLGLNVGHMLKSCIIYHPSLMILLPWGQKSPLQCWLGLNLDRVLKPCLVPYPSFMITRTMGSKMPTAVLISVKSRPCAEILSLIPYRSLMKTLTMGTKMPTAVFISVKSWPCAEILSLIPYPSLMIIPCRGAKNDHVSVD